MSYESLFYLIYYPEMVKNSTVIKWGLLKCTRNNFLFSWSKVPNWLDVSSEVVCDSIGREIISKSETLLAFELEL